MTITSIANFNDRLFENILESLICETLKSPNIHLPPSEMLSKSKTYKHLQNREPEFCSNFIIWLFDEICKLNKNIPILDESELDSGIAGRFFAPSPELLNLNDMVIVFSFILPRFTMISKEVVLRIFDVSLRNGGDLTYLSIRYSIHKKLIKILLDNDYLSDVDKELLSNLADDFPNFDCYDYHSEYFQKIDNEIQELVFSECEEDKYELIFRRSQYDEFGQQLYVYLSNCAEFERKSICNFIWSLKSPDGKKPTKKFLKCAQEELEIFAPEKRVVYLNDLLGLANKARPVNSESNSSQKQYLFTDYTSNILRGLVWVCTDYIDEEMIDILAQLERRCLATIPGKGAGGIKIANAITYVWKSRSFETIK